MNSSEYEYLVTLLKSTRMYYSELITDTAQDFETRHDQVTPKKTNLAWQVCTERHDIISSKVPPIYTDNKLISADRWLAYDKDKDVAFARDSIKPKVQFRHTELPGALSRKVEVERRRREYCSMKITNMLAATKIKLFDLVPPSYVKKFINNLDEYGVESNITHLPLEWFDNEDLDFGSAVSLRRMSVMDTTKHNIPAEAFIPVKKMTSVGTKTLSNFYKWTNVSVVDYDDKDKRMTVLTLDGTKTFYKVARIYVCFKAENPKTLADRIKRAVVFRNLTEVEMKFQLYVDCLILLGIPDLPEELMKRILTFATRNERHKPHKKLMKILVYEVHLNFKRCLGEMEFRETITKKMNKFLHIKMPILNTCAHYSTFKFQKSSQASHDDFVMKIEYVRWDTIFIVPETYEAICDVVEECFKVEIIALFNMTSGKTVTLQDFEFSQLQSIENSVKYLKGLWLEKITHKIRIALRDVGKGWFKLNENSWEILKISKMNRFLELTKFRMQGALRKCVETSILNYVAMLTIPCEPTLNCKDNFEWGQDLTTSFFEPMTTSLFHLVIIMDETGAHYSTELPQFQEVLLRLLDDTLCQTHTIKQIHSYLMPNIRFPSDLFLTSIGLLDSTLDAARHRLMHSYTQAIKPLVSYAKEFNVYLDLVNLDIDEFLESLEEQDLTAFELKDEVSYQIKERNAADTNIPASILIGPFKVTTSIVKQALITKRETIVQRILTMLAARLRIQVDEVIEEYNTILERMKVEPTSIEHIFEIKEWLDTVPLAVRTQSDIMANIQLDYSVLDHFLFLLTQEDFDAKWQALSMPLLVEQTMEEYEEYLINETDRYLKIQLSDEVSLMEKIESMTTQISSMSTFSDINKVHEIAIEMKRLWKTLQEAKEFGLLLNNRQKLFQIEVTPYEEINQLIKELEPYKNLWVTASDFIKWYEIWMENPLISIDGDAIEDIVNESLKTMVKSIRIFSDLPKVQEVAIYVKAMIEEFKPYVPLIQAINSPGMKQRHWDEINEATGLQIVASETLSFKECLEQGIFEHMEFVIKCAESAAKEFAIEESLIKMREEWNRNYLELLPYKDSGTFIMKVSEDHMQLIDDQLVVTQQLSFSPFKGAFGDEIDDWEAQLRLISAVLEEWMECQKQWLYLEPIFSSDDISGQLPVESKKYKTMERNWRRIMKQATDDPLIVTFCNDPKLLESLKECNNLLELVQKGLAEYLETKRTIFPRFYFLSDDELLQILSQAKDPLAVQPHLRKCFENIARLNFEEDLEITHMYSAEDECVAFYETMYPQGNVEDWLVLLEAAMRQTVRYTMRDALNDLEIKSRKDWVLLWPGQIVIAGSQTYWTSNMENAFVNKTMKEYYKIMLEQLDDLRDLVRGTLTNLQRDVLSALIVIEVHARDVTCGIVDDNIKNSNDFDWIKQLRYYWIEDEMKVRAVNAEFPYGYEYLGNSGRLVITPLTDRCYLTLTGALHLKFGGAPAGPAGTGKTETTKDLAKAFAIQCIVFNCSDQLDVIAMGKMLKGLATSGAWACLDEFNRIDIEVLSVVAQQVTTIQKAQQARLDRFFFEGIEINLKPNCAVFITMNPGYAGRTELPDNLKALFRPVAMMVPDYTLIAEISLFSFGFSEAKQLAEKITTTFKISSEQLSTQDHYDFGMRAVKTVIAVAGNLKRENLIPDEKQIVLRALKDSNVPKFLKDDLTLFNGIVSDLFPKMEKLEVDYGDLEESIIQACKTEKLEEVPGYVTKVIQLYDTTIVRHGLMIVGPTGSGKTKCYEVLKIALTKLKGKPASNGVPYEDVATFVVNPKAITMGQLYGEFDALTHEWTDGILSSLVRLGSSTATKQKKWYVFDGPVDAVWIENMNTVLDDNKKLCLSSGEIIKLTESQTMMFEVADLIVASPATVSRCGMVYLEPGILGLEPYLNCWLNKIPQIAEEFTDDFKNLFTTYFFPVMDILRKTPLVEILESVDSAITQSFLQLLDWFLSPLCGKDGKMPPQPQYMGLIPRLIVPWTIFSLIWSVGATCDFESRVIFSAKLRSLMNSNGCTPKIPDEGMVYDYKLYEGGFTEPTASNEPENPIWLSWMDNAPLFEILPDTKYQDIEVPTIDNVRNSALIQIVVFNDQHVLCLGPTGTGKTVTVVSKLSTGLPNKYLSELITFSARTTANQTQDLIDSKLEKRRKGVFGPPLMKRIVLFIDDFNMPALETYGAQPPIELIRQYMDFKGWYDRKAIGEFRNIVDINFVAALGPPGGGRNPITARLLRHFHYLAFPEMQNSSMVKIFGSILNAWLLSMSDVQFDLKSFSESIVNSTIKLYLTIIRELLPTPAKIHYTFNLRDLSKVFQGMLMVDPYLVKDTKLILKLWHHECSRVFQDRLVNAEDCKWFDDLLTGIFENSFKLKLVEIIGDIPNLFGDFMDNTTDIKSYVLITDMFKLSKMLDLYLEEFNNNTTAPMKLVLFLDAIFHVCRISRIIRQPMGNALLLGMSGSGRQSLTRLASHMADYICFQIEVSKNYNISEWKEDIKGVMLKSGLDNRPTVFLFADTQIKSETFMEDLNNILNSGNVPNIYQPDDLEQIYQVMKTVVAEQGLAATKTNLTSCYQKIVRTNLHVVITMSPIGEIFRARMRQFPALVNCCTIDWFNPWPDSALQSVAMQYLDEIEDFNVSKEILEGIVVTFKFMHQSVVDASELFRVELKRNNYVTPTSYLELLCGYTEILQGKRYEMSAKSDRLKTGLDKLLRTAEEVKVLQHTMETMKPALEQAAKEAAVMIAKIAVDTEAAEETRATVEKEELAAAKQKKDTQVIADDASADLEKAMPALREAEQSLKSLNKNDVQEVRSMKRPPQGVHMVMETICICKGVKPIKVAGAKPGEKVLDYWEPSRVILQDAQGFLISLMEYDKDSMTEAIIAKLKPYIDNPLFKPSKIITVSKACTSLCMWVHAMYKYYFVNKVVLPKKAALALAMAELEETEKILAAARQKMAVIMNGLNELDRLLKAKEKFKAEREAEMNLCMDRIGRAVRLVTGLSDERSRWIDTIEEIKHSMVFITGDILLSAGAIAYLTPFTDQYRRGLLSEWYKIIDEKKVPHTENCTPVSTLGEAVLIRKWQIDGLPRDYFSTENAILVVNSRRWPLFVDPQTQANKWVKNMEKPHGLSISKMTDRDLMRTLESAIRLGKPCLIENIGDTLDNALDPVLLKQVYKVGGSVVLKLGDNVIPYNNDFRLYLSTKLANPHYSPIVSIRVLVVNFALVPSGLQDQLLAITVMQERADLEEARGALITSSAQMMSELKDIEDRILYKLSASVGSPVDDIDLITTLESSKVKSEEIKNKVAAAEITQTDIDNNRSLYIPVARRSQILFFCIYDLSTVDPMYQYSLEWFLNIFLGTMESSEAADEIAERITNINNDFTFNLYCNVCRSLFERNKLHFAFLICARLLLDEEFINPIEWNHFLLAGPTPKQVVANPAKDWISPRAWTEILALEGLPTFNTFVSSFIQNVSTYKAIFDSVNPIHEKLPKPWDKNLDSFQKMLVIKALRPDKLTTAIQEFIAHEMGDAFIEPQSTDLGAIFKESGPTIPLIFIISAGTDPASDLYKFADTMKFSKRLFAISLGQGQGPKAELMMKNACEVGSWVFFQNCHLAPSFMPTLDRLIEEIQPDVVHKEFRVWLTSVTSPDFPVMILQNGSKMTVEPPRGIKANMIRAYSNQVAEYEEFFNSTGPKVLSFKLLLFALCLFHGVCLERRKFGALGFNIPYEFTDGDLRICMSQLYMFLLEYSDVPFKVLVYTAGHINYGGRVTDDWDRRCLINILSDFYGAKVLNDSYTFDDRKFYHQLSGEVTIPEMVIYLKTLPLNDDPQIFGLHSNADISYMQAESYICLNTLFILQPQEAAASGRSQEEETFDIATGILDSIKDNIPIDLIAQRYPVSYEESMNTVLMQEALRYQKLVSIIVQSVNDVLLAIQGLVVMSDTLENVSSSLFQNAVPEYWESNAYPSLKPLGPWIADLKERTTFINTWATSGMPNSFWMSGFYFPQAFLTAILQNYARKYVVSIDTINFAYTVLEGQPRQRPANGCNVFGLYLEGACWSKRTKKLDESKPKELYTEMATMNISPEVNHVFPENHYLCPVYKTLTRFGVLSTTGHSTNYVVAVELPSDKSESHWIKRGVALICALDY